jgi:hypothetical protein
MFYVKTQLNEETTLTTEITDENVFTRCPRCGSEIGIDLADILSDGDGDLLGTAVLCNVCARKLHPELRREVP